MNADDMSTPVFWLFYRPPQLSKAVPFHTTSSMPAERRVSPENRAFLHRLEKLESFNSARLGDRANPVLPPRFRPPHRQSFNLNNRQCQNRDRNGTARQCEQAR